MKKNKRQEIILSIIEKKDISTQEQLLQNLNELGYDVTQATISRDIKSLNLIKIQSSNGLYKYSVVKNENSSGDKFKSIFSHSVLSIDFAQNFVVLHCNPGMANAICVTLDTLKNDSIVGTIAGDDTVFILCRTNEDAQYLINEFNDLI